MYWPMCSALIDDENVSPSRSTVSTSSHFVIENVDRPAIEFDASEWMTGHCERACSQIGYGWPV